MTRASTKYRGNAAALSEVRFTSRDALGAGAKENAQGKSKEARGKERDRERARRRKKGGGNSKYRQKSLFSEEPNKLNSKINRKTEIIN